MSDSVQIPVMILNFNGWDDTVASVRRMLPFVDKIWVVDNGSALDRSTDLEALSHRVRTLRLSDNFGWAGGYNRALGVLREAGHNAAYLLNNDATLEPGALESAVATLRADPANAAVGSVILTNEGRSVWFDGEYHGDKQATDLSAGAVPSRTLNGAGFVLNLEALEALGGFHEEYFLYHEEADWFSRARDAGWRLLVDRDSRVHHAREGSDTNFNARYYRLRNRFLASRRGICLGSAPERWRHAFLHALRALKTPELGARFAAAEAILDGLRARFGRRPWQRTKLERCARALLSFVGRLGMQVAARRRRVSRFGLTLLRS